jgi:hypothetical protein
VPAADPDLPSSRSNVQPAGASTESWRIGASPRSVKNEGIREGSVSHFVGRVGVGQVAHGRLWPTPRGPTIVR